jgi:hypothetical protein
MSTTTITFRGLCTFIQHAAHYDVCLLPGTGVDHHGAHPPHLASLSVHVDMIDTDPGQTTWKPDAIVYDKNGGTAGQMGVWKLDRRVVTLTPTPAGPGKAPTFADRKNEIDLSHYHTAAEAKAKTRDQIVAAGASIVQLVDGAIVGREKGKKLKLIRKVGGDLKTQDFVRAYEWSLAANGLKVKIVSSAGTISLKESAKVAISNVAPVMGSASLTHFEHYYETFAQKPQADRLLHLEFTSLDEPVYDCVPPTPGPTP